jgi:diguanylate cyclase (GGDEF)-like protein
MLHSGTVNLLRIIFLALLLQASCNARAQIPPILPFAIDVLDIAKNSVTPEDIVAARQPQAFQPLTRPLENLQVPPGHDTWLRIRLTDDWPHTLPPVLAITPESMMQSMTVYPPPNFVARAYSMFDRQTAPGFSREGIFVPLPTLMKAGATTYVRLKGGLQNTGYISLRLDEYAAMSEFDNRNVRYTTLFLSIFLTVGISTLFCWFFFRERILLLYTLQVAGLFIYVLYIRGDGLSLYFPQNMAFAQALVGGLPVSIYAVFAVLFMREFVELKQYSIWADRAALVFSALFFLCGLSHALAPREYHYPIAIVSNIAYLVWTPLMLGFTAGLARQGNRAAWFLLASWGPSLILGLYILCEQLFYAKGDAIGLLGYPATLAFSSITLVLGVAYRMLQQRRDLDLARTQAQFDGLTGALNRRTTMDRLTEAHGSASAANQPMSVMFIDLDHFKAVNDTYGHAAGDICLKTVVHTIQTNLRHTDLVGRFGGEEFLVVLPGTDTETAMRLAERMREQIAELQVPYHGKMISITTSIGVTNSYPNANTPEDLISLADKALYQAKNDGRNLVRLLAADSGGMAQLA